MESKQTPANASFIIFIFLAAISSFITGYLTMFGRYLEPGYKTTADDISYAGMQIWDLNQPFVVLTIVFYVCAGLSALWPKLFGKPITLAKAFLMWLLLTFLAITFFPYPFEFQLRHYQSAANMTYIMLDSSSGDFIDGNENAFAGSKVEEKGETFYGKDFTSARQFNCVSTRAWWWGNLSVSHAFYPILDKENNLKLLEKNCKEVTNE